MFYSKKKKKKVILTHHHRKCPNNKHASSNLKILSLPFYGRGHINICFRKIDHSIRNMNARYITSRNLCFPW